MDEKPLAHLDEVCVRVLGAAPERVVSFTTGTRGTARRTHRIHIGETTLYATRRKDPRVTAKEAAILRRLAAAHGPVPEVVAFEDGWLLQQSAGAQRLSETLANGSTRKARGWLERAVDGLADLHEAGRSAGLTDVVTPFAVGESTGRRLVEGLDALADRACRPLPAVDRDRMVARLAAPGDAFIKWDARPANAAVGADGRLRWFDWQHANLRHPADDLVWLLCDETVPAAAEPEALLFSAAARWGSDPDRVAALAVAHVGVRLRGCLEGETGLDVPWTTCLANDWLGSRETVRRLCARGAAVARGSAWTAPLAAWFESLEKPLLSEGSRADAAP